MNSVARPPGRPLWVLRTEPSPPLPSPPPAAAAISHGKATATPRAGVRPRLGVRRRAGQLPGPLGALQLPDLPLLLELKRLKQLKLNLLVTRALFVCPRLGLVGLCRHVSVRIRDLFHFHDSQKMSSTTGRADELEQPKSSGMKRASGDVSGADAELLAGVSKKPRGDSVAVAQSAPSSGQLADRAVQERKSSSAQTSQNIHSCSFIGVRWSQIKGKWR